MPKILVLYDAEDPTTRAVADAAAHGARHVRFMEVELGPLSAVLNGLPEHDGLVIVASVTSSAKADQLRSALGAGSDRRLDRIGAAIAPGPLADEANWAALRLLAGAGYLLAPPGDPTALGERVARAAESLAHMRHHQHEHDHGHHHH